jgi:hypothetical protein
MGVKRVTNATRATLDTLAKTDSPAGQVALALAERLDDPDTAATAVAAIAKEHRTTMAELTRAATVVGDPIDELRQRREARRRGA